MKRYPFEVSGDESGGVPVTFVARSERSQVNWLKALGRIVGYSDNYLAPIGFDGLDP
jgi:hypothetical protein